jgi:hypothetical protein
MRTAAVAAALLISLPALAQAPKASALEWLAGTWVAKSEAATVTESWVGPGNGMMVAANLSTWKSGRKFYEFLRIGETAEGLSYYASPGGKAPVEFKSKEVGERRIVFENAQHDFPQRILYWREGEQLVARVEGTAGGKEKREEWRFDRAR